MNDWKEKEKYRVQNQAQELARLQKQMRSKGYQERATFLSASGHYHELWAYKDTTEAVLTVTSELGETLFYKLQKVKAEEM